MVPETVEGNFDVLGARRDFGKTSKFKRAIVVLKLYAIDIMFRRDDTKLLGLDFWDQVHDWNNITEELGQRNVIRLRC